MAELHQRLVVQTQPRNAAGFRGTDQRRGRRAQRAPLREADELVTRLRPAPAFGHAVLRADRLRQQRAKQTQAELAGRDAFVALCVLVDDRVHARCAGTARLAEGDALAGDVLQFDCHVLEHVAQPGAFVLAHAAEEATRFTIRAAVFSQAGERGRKPVDERIAQPAGGPLLELAQVELNTNDWKMSVERRSNVNGPVQDAHSRLPP